MVPGNEDVIPLPSSGRGHRNNARRGRGGRHHGGRGGGRRGGWNSGRSGRGRGVGRGRGWDRNQSHDIANDPVEVIGERSSNSVTIAIEGCCHGELDSIYERLKVHETKSGEKIDLLLCCGDFQSHRNPSDFHSSSIPPKFRRLGTFPKYYAGEKRAPILTIFIGGNHEASQPLRELYYGGWVAPNIYYLGAAGVVRYGGLRIGGLSGIYKSHDYKMGHFETVPLDNSTLRSIYHIRNVDVYRLKCLSDSKDRVDVVLSHDWPLGIEQHGNTRELLKKKPFFRQEVEQNTLGNPANREILDILKPRLWFSAHLHVKFKATVQHEETTAPQNSSPDASQLLIPSQVPRESKRENSGSQNVTSDPSFDPKQNDETQDFKGESDNNQTAEASQETHQDGKTEFHAFESATGCGLPDLTAQMTKFLALDKCLPRRHYLSIMHVDSSVPKADQVLEYDPEWLAIMRKTHHLICKEKRRVIVPQELVKLEESDVAWVVERIEKRNKDRGLQGVSIPTNFTQTAPTYRHPLYNQGAPVFQAMGNPQTDELLEILELDHKVTIPFDRQVLQMFDISDDATNQKAHSKDDNEIDIDDMASGDDCKDQNEIDLDDNSTDSNRLEANDVRVGDAPNRSTRKHSGGGSSEDRAFDELHGQVYDQSAESEAANQGTRNATVQGEATEPQVAKNSKDPDDDAGHGSQVPLKKPRCNS